MPQYEITFNSLVEDYDSVFEDVGAAMRSLIPVNGRWELTKVTDIPTQLREMKTQLDRLEARLQGVIETHHLWDGS